MTVWYRGGSATSHTFQFFLAELTELFSGKFMAVFFSDTDYLLRWLSGFEPLLNGLIIFDGGEEWLELF